MKRYNHLFEKIVAWDNLLLAADKALRGKSHRRDVLEFERNRDELLRKLQLMLIDGTYTTSEYKTFTIHEPKERLIYKLPFYPDRIVHHAIMNILERIWVSTMIALTYSCIKGRGIHKALHDVKVALKDRKNTKYCLKLDIRHFYPTIDHNILKLILRRKLKDNRLLALLDEIIDSTDGVPIGNYLSLFFANLYLNYFDHNLKEDCKLKYYFRYADDIVILSSNKSRLRRLLDWIRWRLQSRLNLKLKGNHQLFDIDRRGIDFVGYKFYHTYILLRKRIKKNYCRRITRLNKIRCSIDYYKRKLCGFLGWLKHCNSTNLAHKTGLEGRLLVYINIA